MKKWLLVGLLFIIVAGCAYQYSYQKTVTRSRMVKNPADTVNAKPPKKQ